MKRDNVSRRIEIGTLVVNIATAIATVTVAVTALKLQRESSSVANAIAMQSVEVAKIGTDLQIRLVIRN